MTFHLIVKYWPTENRSGIYHHLAHNFETIGKNHSIQLVCAFQESIDLRKARPP